MCELSEQIKAKEYLILRVIYKYRLFYDKELYMQVGRLAIWQAIQEFDATKGDFDMYVYMRVKFAIIRELHMQSKVRDNEVTVADEQLGLLKETVTLPACCELERPQWYDLLYSHEQRLIEWLYYEGYSMKEVAQLEGVTYEVIKKRRKRLFTKIKALLKT